MLRVARRLDADLPLMGAQSIRFRWVLPVLLRGIPDADTPLSLRADANGQPMFSSMAAGARVGVASSTFTIGGRAPA